MLLREVDHLTTNPSLISSPSAPIFRGSSYDFPYSQIVTTIYATTGDNFLGDSTFIARTPATYQPLVLPAGAQFAYPGRWTSTVTRIDGAVPYDIPHFLQGNLTLPAGTVGPVVMPWMLWELRGAGHVSIAGTTYEIGSEDLQATIQSPGRQILSVDIVESSSDLEFIFRQRHALWAEWLQLGKSHWEGCLGGPSREVLPFSQ